MGEVDQPTLRIPDVLAVDDDAVPYVNGSSCPDGDVVLHLDGEVPGGKLDDELFVGAGAAGSVGQEPYDRAIGGDLDVGLMVMEVGHDGRVIRLRGRATGRERHRHRGE